MRRLNYYSIIIVIPYLIPLNNRGAFKSASILLENKMSELNMNGFFEAVKAQLKAEQADKILKQARDREDQWWSLYKKGLVKYDKDTNTL